MASATDQTSSMRTRFESGRLDLDAVRFDEGTRWMSVRRGESFVLCNFAPTAQRISIAEDATRMRVSLASKPEVRLDGAAIDMPSVCVAILTPKDSGLSTGALK